jgi:glycosyltransferase involved in cell wall biosynthesis
MKQEFPKVTIVTVTYNAEKFVEETIKSVIEQDYPNIEYIIIDGGSSDGTVDIIKKYESHLAYWISESDSGIYDAMNKGIDAATGEWINFMNAGDSFCEKNTLSGIVKYLDTHTDILCGDIYLIGKTREYQKAPGLSKAFEGMFCFHQTMFTRTVICKQYKFDTGFKVAGDYDFVLKCYVSGLCFKFLSFPIANFMDGGISSSQQLKGRIEEMFIQSKYLQDSSEIFNLNSYHQLRSLSKDSSYLLSVLFNKFIDRLGILDFTDKKIILYGFGHFGKMMYEYFKDSIVLVVDANADNLQHDYVFKPEAICETQFDYIIISVLGRETEITDTLVKRYGIIRDKIVLVSI